MRLTRGPCSRPESAARETRVRVRYAETDRMGVAYHAEYLVWYEVGRTDWLRGAPGAGEGRELSYRRLEEAGYFLPVIEVASRYHSPARYDDELVVRTRLSEATRARLAFDYEIERPSDGRLLARGRTVHAVTDAAGRPRRLAPHLLESIVADPGAFHARPPMTETAE